MSECKNSADFDPIFPDLSFRLFRNIFGRSTLVDDGFECHSKLACEQAPKWGKGRKEK